jgi:uncharacterized metal-binding protein YceD (DUF177 family)
MSDDFTHRLRLDQLRDGERIELVADEKERTAIAKRLDLEKLERLEAHAALSRMGDVVRARGRVAASLDQRCVVTGDRVAAHIDEPFEITFVPEPEPNAEEEIELGAADCDTIFHDGAGIELGSAIADTLALALDPYPRSAGAEAALKEAGVLNEEQAGPFAALAQLKKDLGGSKG